MTPSIFTQIVNGDIPAYKIYEDDLTLAFLDIHPVQPGHVLVIPKQQIEFVWDLPDDLYQAVMATTKKVALRMRETLKVPYVGVQIIGVHVPHVHVQLIPFSTAEEYFNHADPTARPDHDFLAVMAKRLQF